VLLLGNSGMGKTYITLVLVRELIEARDDKKRLRFEKQIASYELLLVDESGFVPLSKAGAELLFTGRAHRIESQPESFLREPFTAPHAQEGLQEFRRDGIASSYSGYLQC